MESPTIAALNGGAFQCEASLVTTSMWFNKMIGLFASAVRNPGPYIGSAGDILKYAVFDSFRIENLFEEGRRPRLIARGIRGIDSQVFLLPLQGQFGVLLQSVARNFAGRQVLVRRARLRRAQRDSQQPENCGQTTKSMAFVHSFPRMIF